MILPPLYFPVYHLHLRLPEPGLHAQPLIESPPMAHLEGVHSILWATSDPSKLSSTIIGDFNKLALRDFDSGAWIPHIPIPLMAGPFLVDTLQQSHYTIIFHQPNIKLDGTEVGVFFWGLAMPWRCFEVKLPVPKFLQQRAKIALGKAADSALNKAIDKAAKAEKAVEDALDALPAGADDRERRKDVMKKAEANAAAQKEVKKAESFKDSQKYLDEREANDAKARAESAAEKKANQDKLAADAASRQATRDAEQHEVAARAHREQSVGATDGTTEDAERAERSHRAAASSERSMAESEDRRADAHAARASSHRSQQAMAEERSRRADATADHHEAQARAEDERAAGVRAGGSGDALENADRHDALAKEQREQARAESRQAQQHAAQAQAHEDASAAATRSADASRTSAEANDAKADANAHRVQADRHQQAADRSRRDAAAAGQASKQHAERAKKHAEGKKYYKREKQKADDVELNEKHGKLNPYKKTMGMGNTGMLIPSVLAHVPVPATVQIYMSWEECQRNWGKALVKLLATLVNSYVGFIFDSILAPGKQGLAKWLLDTGKSIVTDTIVGGLEKYLIDKKVEVKLNLKKGPVSVTLTLDKEQPPPAAGKDTTNDKPKDDWKWSAKAEGKKGAGNGSGKVTGSASASASGTWPSSDGTASPTAGANESPRVIDQWSVQGGAEAGKFEATAQRTSATGTAPETKAEIGHHELLNADGASAPVSPATNAAPPVDYTHGSSLVP